MEFRQTDESLYNVHTLWIHVYRIGGEKDEGERTIPAISGHKMRILYTSIIKHEPMQAGEQVRNVQSQPIRVEQKSLNCITKIIERFLPLTEEEKKEQQVCDPDGVSKCINFKRKRGFANISFAIPAPELGLREWLLYRLGMLLSEASPMQRPSKSRKYDC